MKNIFYLFLTFVTTAFFTINASAQTNGKVYYTTILESQDFKKLQGVLLFDKYKSIFYYEEDSAGDNSDKQAISIDNSTNLDVEFNFNFGEPLSSYHKVFIDRFEKKILSSERYFEDGIEHPCITVESTGLFRWTITNERKKIGSFDAIKATTYFRGRNYTAWFSTDLPIGIGPWKFHGLPGLILEIYDRQKGVQFLLSSVEIPSDTNIEIIPPTNGKKITIEQFAKFQEDFANEFVELIKAKLPRGVDISRISISQVNKGIEREYK